MNGAAVWMPAYIGLGSNLDDPPGQLRRAAGAIGNLPSTRVVAISRFYRNPPMGVPDQPYFVNAVAAVLTQLAAPSLLAGLKEIEVKQGRRRTSGNRWGPRVIDLDLLVFGSLRVNEGGLTLPHSGITERNFVLFPLAEVAPGLHVPGCGPVRDLVKMVDGGTLEPVG